MEKKKYFRVLTIAGSDSGGGAGIQADLKTFSALGCYGMSVITALTAQNTVAVTAIHEVPADFVGTQIDAVMSDIGVDAVKIGMLQSSEIIRVVAQKLKYYDTKNIVLDPVMAAKSGDKLLLDDAIEILKQELIPIATIITPNIPEAEVLSGMKISEKKEMLNAAKALLSMGPKGVLVKGGHTNDEKSTDCLCIRREKNVDIEWFETERIVTKNTHGTGCTLSSAIASFLARGFDLKFAVAKAKSYITETVKAGAEYQIGKGQGPVLHFFNFWGEKSKGEN